MWHRLDEYPLDPRTQMIFIRLAESDEQTRRVVLNPQGDCLGLAELYEQTRRVPPLLSLLLTR